MKTTRVSTRGASGHLEDDSLDDVGHVLAAIGDRLEGLVDLLPLDHLDGVGLALEQGGELVAQEAVGLVLESVHLDGVLGVEGRERAQAVDRAMADAGYRAKAATTIEEGKTGERVTKLENKGISGEPITGRLRSIRTKSGISVRAMSTPWAPSIAIATS